MKNHMAFPVHGSMGEVVQPGMTMRQYYKAAALQGLIASYANGSSVPSSEDAKKFVSKMADAMIAEDEAFEKANP